MRLVRDNTLDANIELIRMLGMRAHDQRKGWRRVGRHLKQVTAEQFTTEGVRLNRRRWQALNPDYASRKRAAGFTGGILTRTGEMKRSFRVLKIRKNMLEFGSTLDRAAWHHHGGGNLPRRKILNAGRGITRDVNRILTDYIIEGIV